MSELITLILCGGEGERLWPASRSDRPKPFISVGGGKLICSAVDRAIALGSSEIYLAVNEKHLPLYQRLFAEMVGPPINYVVEPIAKNTGPAVALASRLIRDRHGSEAIMVVMSADHIIRDLNRFCADAENAVQAAIEGDIVMLGVVPTSAESGFGYIETASSDMQVRTVIRFVEKPDPQTAKSYIDSGRFLWNSGIFFFSSGTILDSFERYAPELAFASERVFKSKKVFVTEDVKSNSVTFDELEFQEQPRISIDCAVLERAANLKVVAATFDWSDVGTWDSLFQATQLDVDGNASEFGEVSWHRLDTTNSRLFVDMPKMKKNIVTIGVDGLAVIDTPGALFVADVARLKDIKDLRSTVGENESWQNFHFSNSNESLVERPWGNFVNIDAGDGYKVKRINIKAGEEISLQYHSHRGEHWVVIRGRGKVKIGDRIASINPGDYCYVPVGETHQLINDGLVDLLLIEVQVGDLVIESDITRVSDKYGRP